MVDVAREAGVALRTVSRLVNGDDTVGRENAERIRAAIDALGYQPDERARQLRSGRTLTLGATVRNIANTHPILRAIDESARAVGLSVVGVSTEDDPEREHEAIMSMCRRRMDGIIIEPVAESHAYLQPQIDSGMPVVAFDRPAAGIAVDTVLSDNCSGIRQAFAHLAVRGHRRIAYIGDDERIFTGHERAETFRECLRALGASTDGMVHPGPVRPDRIAAVLDALHRMDAPPTALITGNATTTVEAVRHLGADFGSIALVGCDDFALADLLRPALTVIARDETQIGRTALDMYRERVANPAGPARTIVMPTMLIARGSGEVPP
jgi:LacI family transcriptional regulator, galactose operon repressor